MSYIDILCISYIRKLYIYIFSRNLNFKGIILLYRKVQTPNGTLKKLKLPKKVLSTRETTTCVRRQAYLYLITSILFEQLMAGGLSASFLLFPGLLYI